jgi:hypothetical protein
VACTSVCDTAGTGSKPVTRPNSLRTEYEQLQTVGLSFNGRIAALQAADRGFDSPQLHHAIGVRNSRTPRCQRGGAGARPAGRTNVGRSPSETKAVGCKPSMRWCKSSPALQNYIRFRSSTVEHSVVNREVVGSSPIGTAKDERWCNGNTRRSGRCVQGSTPCFSAILEW